MSNVVDSSCSNNGVPVGGLFPGIDRGMLELELVLANPSMDDLPSRVVVATDDDADAAVNVEDAPPPAKLLFPPRRYTGGRGELEMPDLEVQTLLPDGDVGRGVGVADANNALLALRDDDEDFGGGVWGENLEDGDAGGGGGGGGCCSGLMRAVEVEDGDADGATIIAGDVGRGPPPAPAPATPDDMLR